MEINTDEALRYLGAGAAAPAALRREVGAAADWLSERIEPRYVLRAFELTRENGVPTLIGAGVTLPGESAARLLEGCDMAALLCCTLGAEFDTLLRYEQARDMARAVIIDACAGALVEAGCGAAERELKALFPGKYLTERFSPGYGDLPLEVSGAILSALDAGRRLGVYMTESMLMNPLKTVSAVIGMADSPRPSRIRGCDNCDMRDTCAMNKGGGGCEI